MTEMNVCYICICDKSYPKKLAFSFLEEIQREFHSNYGDEVDKATRPYAFIKFDLFLQKTKKSFQDSQSNNNLTRMNEELQDVTRIMTKNIQEVLQRGEKIDKLSEYSSRLTSESKKFSRDARNLNLQALYRKYGPLVIVVFIILFIIYWWWTG